MSSSTTRRAVSLPPPPPTPPSPAASTTALYGRPPTSSRCDSLSPLSPANHVHQQVVIGKDLCRAIRELQAVPSLKGPIENIEFNEDYIVVDDDCVFDYSDHVEQLQPTQHRQQSELKINCVDIDRCGYYSGSSYSNAISASSARTSLGARGEVAQTSKSATPAIGVFDARLVGEQFDGSTAWRSESQTSDYESPPHLSAVRTNAQPSPEEYFNFEVSSNSATTAHSNGSGDNSCKSTGGGRSDPDAVTRTQLLHGTHSNDASRAAGVPDVGPTTTELCVFSDEMDVYEKQMEDLERVANSSCDDDYDERTNFDSEFPSECNAEYGSYYIGRDDGECDDRTTSCSSFHGSGVGSLSNFSGTGYDADWMSPTSCVGSSEIVDWEEVVNEKERFVRSVLTRRRQLVENKTNGSCPENIACEKMLPVNTVCSRSQDAATVSGDDIASDHQDCAGVARHKVTFVNSNESDDDVTFASVFEQRSTITKKKLTQVNCSTMMTSSETQAEVCRIVDHVDNSAHTPDNFSVKSNGETTVKLNCKPGRVKTIQLGSFALPRPAASTHITANKVSTQDAGNSSISELAAATFKADDAVVDFSAEELFEEILESMNDDDVIVADAEGINEEFVCDTIKLHSPVSAEGQPQLEKPIEVGTHEIGLAASPSSWSRSSVAAGVAVRPTLVPLIEDDGELATSAVDYENTVPQQMNYTVSCDQVVLSDDSTRSVLCFNGENEIEIKTFEETKSIICAPTDGDNNSRQRSFDETTSESGTDDSQSSRLTVKSLRTYFEHQMFVQTSTIQTPPSSAKSFLRGDQYIDVASDESDNDLDSVVNSNVNVIEFFNVDDSVTLDGLVDRNSNAVAEATSHGPSSSRTTQLPQHGRQSTDFEWSLVAENESAEFVSEPSPSRLQLESETAKNPVGLSTCDVTSDVKLFTVSDNGKKVENRLPKTDVSNEDVVRNSGEGDDVINEDQTETKMCVQDTSPFQSTSGDSLTTGHVVSYSDDKTMSTSSQGTVEILSDCLTTQEIVLTVKLPRHLRFSSRNPKSRQADAASNNATPTSGGSPTEICQLDNNTKIPFRHLHAKRVIRVVDENGQMQSTWTNVDESGMTTTGPQIRSEIADKSRVSSDDDDGTFTELQVLASVGGTAAEATDADNSTSPVNEVSSLRTVNVELDRKSRSSGVEFVPTPVQSGDRGPAKMNEVNVVREEFIRVVHLPGFSTDSVRLPVTMPIEETIDDVARVLAMAANTDRGLPPNVRITCEAIEQKETLVTSSPESSLQQQQLVKADEKCGNAAVTVIHRTLLPFDEKDINRIGDVAVTPGDAMTSRGGQLTVTSFV